MTLPLAREFAAHAIRVVAIAPGIFASERILEAWPEERRSAITADVPHPNRLGEPAEFAAMVLWWRTRWSMALPSGSTVPCACDDGDTGTPGT